VAASHMLSLLMPPVCNLLPLYMSNSVTQPGEYVGIYDYLLHNNAQSLLM